MEISTASAGEADSHCPEFNVDARSDALLLPGVSASDRALSPLEKHMKYGALDLDFAPEFSSFDAEFFPVCNIASLEL
jgi:hypothetical protein